MLSLHVTAAGGASYPLAFAPLTDLPDYLEAIGLTPRPCLIITDDHVRSLHVPELENVLESSGWPSSVLSLAPGESSKSLSMLEHVYDWALPLGIERGTPLIGMGGGVVGDLAGLAASTLLRGLPLLHIPTTLLAQVDSSIGGKTGINHSCGKNLIGTFYPPELVLSDVDLLRTLPAREFNGGIAEVVKHALIAGDALLRHLEASLGQLLRREPDVVAAIVPEAAAAKAAIVSADEREGGIRAYLNFGHTTGHALEKAAGYGEFTHGEAVAVGMSVALLISEARHPDADFDLARRLVASVPVLPPTTSFRASELIDAMTFDKKRSGGSMRFVLLRSTGAPYLDSITVPEFEAAWNRLSEIRS